MPLRIRRLVVAAALFLIVLLLYAPVRGFDFINYDDDLYVYDNAQVTAGLSGAGLRWSLSATHAANWHPLTWLSHMLDCELYGRWAGGHHLTNVYWHGANAVLLFWILQGLLAGGGGNAARGVSSTSPVTRATARGTFWTCAVVAAIVAVHPTRVESVAWISERKDLLSVFFGLAAIAAYVRYCGTAGVARRCWYALSMAGFACALLAKPMLVTLPVLLLLLDYWPLGRLSRGGASTVRRALIEKLPFLALSAGSVLITLQAQWAGGAVRTLQVVPVGARVENALVSAVAYIGKLFWPHPLAVFYPLRRDLSGGVVLGALLLLVVITAVAWWQQRRRPYLLMGWMWYLVAVAPVIGLVQVGNQAMADRYTYLPSIGLVLALALLVHEGWTGGWRHVAPHVRQLAGYFGTTALLVVLAAAACTTRATLRHWAGSIPLFEQALRVTRGNWLAHNNLGFAREQAGQVEAAIAHYAEAIRISPDYVVARYNLGNLLTRLGRYAEAEEQFRAALRYAPRDARTLTNFGACLLAQGRPAEALPILMEALERDAGRAETHNNLGHALAQLGQTDAAIAHYRGALRLRPGFLDAQNNLGVALADRGDVAEAERVFQLILERLPDNVEARYNLGVALSRQERTAEAMAAFRAVLAVAPDYAEAAARLAALEQAP